MNAKPSSFQGKQAEGSLFTNVFSFMRRPLTRALGDADVVVMGVPYDLATSGRSGTRFGPNGIRQASANLAWEDKRWPWSFDVFERLNVIDYGDIAFETGDSAGMVEALQQHAGAVLRAGKTLLSLGGDHFIALPLLREHVKRHGKVALVHFDAHTDTAQSDAAFDHGSMFYAAQREDLLDTGHSIQVGIRTEYEVAAHPFEVIDAAAADEMCAADIVAAIRDRVGRTPAYLSFDIDCLDPACAPGTGTPVAGGLTSAKALAVMRGLVGLKLVGMDLVEVAPAYDQADVTSLAAATLALEFLYVLAATRQE